MAALTQVRDRHQVGADDLDGYCLACGSRLAMPNPRRGLVAITRLRDCLVDVSPTSSEQRGATAPRA